MTKKLSCLLLAIIMILQLGVTVFADDHFDNVDTAGNLQIIQSGNTITDSISKIKTFYHYNRVTIPFIPPLNKKYVNKNDLISFADLPTKDELRLAMQFADDELKMWIMVIISSGASRCEAKSMTNRTLFEGTKTYHKKDN